MLKWFLWLKYLRARPIVLLCIAAVALSVMLLTVVSSLFGSFIAAVEKTGREAFGDVYCSPRRQVADFERFAVSVRAIPRVEAAAVVVESYGLLHLGRGNVRAVRVIGIDGDYSAVTSLNDSLLRQAELPPPAAFDVPGHPEADGCFVGIGVLARPDGQTDRYDMDAVAGWAGRQVVLTTGSNLEDLGFGGDGRGQVRHRHVKLRVADVVFTGIYLRDNKDLYVPAELLAELAGPARRQALQVRIADGIDPELMLEPVRCAWLNFARENGIEPGRLFLSTSGRMQQYFVAELRKQMSVLMLIFGIVCSAAVLLIFCVFYILVTSKARDIAIVKSCGANRLSVVSVFLGFGCCVGLIGAAAGSAAGAFVTVNINTIENWIRVVFGLKLWKSSTYIFERIPCQVDPAAAAWVAAAVVLAAAAGAVAPAILAARTDPVKILRYE